MDKTKAERRETKKKQKMRVHGARIRQLLHGKPQSKTGA
jgi:hypothetical protein